MRFLRAAGFWGMGCSLLGVGCALDVRDSQVDVEAEVDGEDVAQLEQEILNGSTGSGWDNRSVKIGSNYITCSGTLIREDWVLTARHCVTTDNTINGPLWSTPSEIRIRKSEATSVNVAASAIYGHPWLDDIALLKLASRLPLDNESSPDRAFTEIFGGSFGTAGTFAFCRGYGQQTAPTELMCEDADEAIANGSWSTDTNPEHAVLSVEETSRSGDEGSDRMSPIVNVRHDSSKSKALSFGDSGSSCGVGGGADHAKDQILSVASRQSGCSFRNEAVGWLPDVSYSMAATGFRSWVNNILAYREEPLIASDPGLCERSFVESWYPSGSPPSWTCVMGLGGYRHDGSNVGAAVVANQINWGPMIIHRQFPKNNVIVSVYVRSSDNDTAAVIARWVDVSNYYFFSADPQNDRAQIVKVKNGLFSLLAVAPLTQIGSTWPNGSVKLELHALGPHLTGLINGNLAVTVSDGNAPHTTGYTGFMHAHMSDVAFSDFRATPKHDSQAFNASARSE